MVQENLVAFANAFVTVRQTLTHADGASCSATAGTNVGVVSTTAGGDADGDTVVDVVDNSSLAGGDEEDEEEEEVDPAPEEEEPAADEEDPAAGDDEDEEPTDVGGAGGARDSGVVYI